MRHASLFVFQGFPEPVGVIAMIPEQLVDL